MPRIDSARVEMVAKTLRRYRIDLQTIDRFEDPEFYPSKSDDYELQLRYFLVMVAMDHRLYRPNRDYVARIRGKIYRGSQLLYYLGKKKYDEDPEFFSPQGLKTIEAKDIVEWLSIDGATPPDPEIRAWLLRDLAHKLIVFYDGKVSKILDECRNYLRRSLGNGLLDILRMFRAYEDPVEKKSLLLAKFLERRGMFEISDVENKNIPVDNHVSRIALRLGIVELEEDLYRKVIRGIEVSRNEDIVIRYTVRDALYRVAKLSGIDIFVLDDILWHGGRTVCLYNNPKCTQCSGSPLCKNGRCIFLDVCKQREKKEIINEHIFFNTWYY